MLDVGFVVAVHDEIIATFGGLAGFAGGGIGGVESALGRVENHAIYAGQEDQPRVLFYFRGRVGGYRGLSTEHGATHSEYLGATAREASAAT